MWLSEGSVREGGEATPRGVVCVSDEKKVKSFTVDRGNAEFLTEQDNASALVNDLVEKYRTDGNRELAALELRREQKRRELEQAREEVARLENDLEEIDALIDDADAEEASKIEDASESLPPSRRLDHDNPAVENWARKLGMPVSTFLEELREYRQQQ